MRAAALKKDWAICARPPTKPVEFLSGRIAKGRELAAKLERLTADGRRFAWTPRPPLADRGAWSGSGPSRPIEPALRAPADHEAAAESLVLKLSEVLDSRPGSGAQPMCPVSPGSRAAIDDDLFEVAPRHRLLTPRPAPPRAFVGGR